MSVRDIEFETKCPTYGDRTSDVGFTMTNKTELWVSVTNIIEGQDETCSFDLTSSETCELLKFLLKDLTDDEIAKLRES